MGGSSRSSNSTTSKSTNFNNVGDSGAGNGFAGNVNLAESTLKVGDVISTDHGAITSAIGLADDVTRRNNQTFMDFSDNAFDDLESSRALTNNLFTGAVDSVNSANREALQFLGQGTERALAFAQKSTRSEASQTVETLTKYMLIGGAGIAGLILLRGNK